MLLNEALDQFVAVLYNEAETLGRDLTDELDELTEYAGQRAQHLANIINEPGFDDALRMERNNIALRAGLSAVEEADAFDQRLIGIIQGALRFLASAASAVI